MNRTLPRAALVACIMVTLLGCPRPPEQPDTLDASTGAGEWDGSYVPLPETGSLWTDTGPLSPCSFPEAGGNCEDFSSFDLSGCDQEALANADFSGLSLLTTRFHGLDGGAYDHDVYRFGFSSDGGTTAYLDNLPANELRQGNARLYITRSYYHPNWELRRVAIVTCSAPRATEFNGCYAVCRNGVMTHRATFASTRLQWREGETEASGLELVSESAALEYPMDVHVTQDHAYVVSRDDLSTQVGGLSVFDVRDKTAPVLVKRIQPSGDMNWKGVWAKGNALYVASQGTQVVVFDITDPADPRFVRTLGTGGYSVFVDGDRLYATAFTGIHIYDVTTPTNPLELARYKPGSGYPHNMFAVGNRLYVNHAADGYFIADTSNLNGIRTLGHYTYAPGEESSHANAVGTFGGRTIAFVGGASPGEHLRVLDITDPAAIVRIGEFKLRPAIPPNNMVLVGKKLYLSWNQEGVRVLDVSNPTRPTQVAYFNTYRERDPHRGDYQEGAIGIRVPGDGYIYTVDSSRGLLILREK